MNSLLEKYLQSFCSIMSITLNWIQINKIIYTWAILRSVIKTKRQTRQYFFKSRAFRSKKKLIIKKNKKGKNKPTDSFKNRQKNMENFVKRFPGVSEQIFNKLEDQSLAACNEASREWNNFLTEERFWWIRIIQVNLCQKLLFFHQLTHNMTTDSSLKYKFNT